MFRLLGSLTIDGPQGAVQIGGPKRRGLIAYLLVHAGAVVSLDRIVDDLWEQDPTEGATRTVRTYVSQLRRVFAGLDAHVTLSTRSGGYALELPPEELDVARFERLCTEAGREHDPANRLVMLQRALDLWHGTPLAEFSGAAWADAFATRLEARRLEALHQHADALLALGRHGESIPELENLVGEHPLDERFWAQLLIAYFRAGRQVDALRAYQTLRSTLADELGIAPSAELRSLERQLLDQDPALLAPNIDASSSGGHPQTQYAMSGNLAIAYQVIGDGPIDILVMPTGYSMMEPSWEWPALRDFWRRLARIGRVVQIDQRGMGLSDRVANVPTPEERLDDVRAVADAIGASRFALIGGSAGGATSALFAATHPERVQSLVLLSPLLLGSGGTPELPGWADTAEEQELITWYLQNRWGSGESAELRLAPSLAGDPKAREWVGRMERLAGTPTSMAKVIAMNREIDVRTAVPAIAAPTLVVQQVGDQDVPIAHGRYYAEHIPGAEYLELPGDDHWWWVGPHAEEITRSIETFLSRQRSLPAVERILKTVLHVDVMGECFAAPSPDTHRTIIAPVIVEHRGIEADAGDDGYVVYFDGPARAIRAARSLVDAAASADLTIRVGLHTGECEVRGDQLGGLAVRIGRSVTDLADAGEVLATSTVRDLVAGSGLRFLDRGRHRLAAAPGEWQLMAIAD